MSDTLILADKIFAVVVDELGLIKAQIAQLEKTEKDLKAVLIKHKQEKYSGTMYDVSVTYDQVVREHIVQEFKKTTVRVTAKK